MPKYEGSDYRCAWCGKFFHSRRARDICESRHEEEE